MTRRINDALRIKGQFRPDKNERPIMKLDEAKWKAAYIKALADLQKQNPTIGASDGIVCAVASIRVIRDGLHEDAGSNESGEEIKAGLNELIGQLSSSTAPKLAGFASNASSAAAACKLKVATVSALASGLAD